MNTRWHALTAMILCAWTMSCERSLPQRNITVLAAASVAPALQEVAEHFTHDTGVIVNISAGPTNSLAQQIIAGAPADLFLSANTTWMDPIAEKGLVAQQCNLLSSALVLIAPKDNPAEVHAPIDLLSDRVRHVALAGEKVPAGIYAQQALAALNLYQPLLDRERIVRGQDVRVTLTYVERGEADAGVVYATDAAASTNVIVVHRFDAATHDRIVYPLALLHHGRTNPAAGQFYLFLQSEEAQQVFAAHGFLQP